MLLFGAWLAVPLIAWGDPNPPAFHAVAFVNDSLSHGVVGDALLSLNEAILLHNGQLTYAQLSAAEQAQLSLIPGTGATTDVTWIDIDGSNTPVITIQQDLAPVQDTTFGLLIKGFSDRPTFDFSGAGVTRGLWAPTNSLTVQDVVFLGGPFGIDAVQTDVSGQAGLVLHNVSFAGQAQFGVRVVASTANGTGRVILQRCTFVNCPLAVVHDESAVNRTSIFEAHEVDIAGALAGFDVALGAGGTTRYTFDRVTIEAAARGIRLTRGPAANRPALVEGSFVRVRAADCVALQCHATGLTWAQLHLWDLRTTALGAALELGAPGAALFGELTEMTLEGDVAIGAGPIASPLSLRNLRCKQGTVSLGGSAAQPVSLAECRFDGCAVSAAGTGPVAASQCCFVGGSLAGTASAPLLLIDSYAQNAGAFVQVAQSLPAAQLGSMAIVPEDVSVGASVQFVADLPPGLVGVFALGFTDATPSLLGSPFQIYFELATYTIVPGAYVLQQGFAWSVPTSASYAGTDLVVQLLVLPTTAQAPWLQLPPGRRFVLR
jgi:hypothetical protein